MLTKTDPRGITTTTYDDLDPPLAVSHSDAAPSAGFAYDQGAYGRGLSTVSNAWAESAFSYDKMGRMLLWELLMIFFSIQLTLLMLLSYQSGPTADPLIIPVDHAVVSLAVADDGSLIAGAVGGQTVLWSSTGSEVARVHGHGVRFLDSHNLLVVDGEGLRVIGGNRWRETVRTLPWPYGSDDRPMSYTVDQSGSVLTTASEAFDGRTWVQVMSIQTGTVEAEFEVDCPEVTGMAVSGPTDGGLLALACMPAQTLNVYSWWVEEMRSQFALHDLPQMGPGSLEKGPLLLTRDGRFLLSGHFDGQLRVWDIKRGERIRLEDAGSHVRNLLLGPHESHLLSLTVGEGVSYLQVRQIPSFRSRGIFPGLFNIEGTMALSKSGTLAVYGAVEKKERIPAQDGRVLEHKFSSPCLLVYRLFQVFDVR